MLTIDPYIKDLLKQHRNRQIEERIKAGTFWKGEQWGDLVFATEEGSPVNGSWMTHHFEKTLVRAGVDEMRWHDLRHSSATIALALGAGLRDIMDQLGHNDIGKTMNTYAHVIARTRVDNAGRVGTALFAAK